MTLKQRVLGDHPLRGIRRLTNVVLWSLSGELDTLYSVSDCADDVLRALLLQAFYSVRSERQQVEELDYNLLFHWPVGWEWTMRCGTRQCFRRTGTGC